MRILGKVESELEAQTFSNFLLTQNIEAVCEPARDHFIIWVIHEQDLSVAKEWFEKYRESPDDPQFQVKAPPPQPKQVKVQSRTIRISPKPWRRGYWLTKLLIAVCAILYFYNSAQKPLPPFGLTKLAGDLIIEDPQHIPYFTGFYAVILGEGDLSAPILSQVMNGEIWRLVTPIFMHADLLHILFNMLWLYLLGKHVEMRLGAWRMAVLMIVAAVISNLAQYFMSGPFFLGFSGVVVALAGYVWVRMKEAPWEGYPIHPSTFIFLFIFVIGMAVLQLVSFVVMYFHLGNFPLNIANTAHIVGGLVGYTFGKLRYHK